MSPSLLTLALWVGGIFGSVLLIPPWLVYVKTVNDSVRKAEAILMKKSSLLFLEHEEILKELETVEPGGAAAIAYKERMQRAYRESEQYKIRAETLSREGGIADWERDWTVTILLSWISTIPYFGYRLCKWASGYFTSGISTFMANRLVKQLEAKGNG